MKSTNVSNAGSCFAVVGPKPPACKPKPPELAFNESIDLARASNVLLVMAKVNGALLVVSIVQLIVGMVVGWH